MKDNTITILQLYPHAMNIYGDWEYPHAQATA